MGAISRFVRYCGHILSHKSIEVPIFLIAMFLGLNLSFWFGSYFGDLIMSGVNSVQYSISGIASKSEFPLFLGVLSGILVGIGTAASFIPSIVMVSIVISLFEQTGYVSKLSNTFGKMFNIFGLTGKSVIPLIAGTGCSIPAYLSTRMIENNVKRFLTMIAIGFVPCSAKIAVFIIFCQALFTPVMASIIMFLIFIFGMICGLVVAKVVSFFYERAPEIYDMDCRNIKCTMPSFKTLYRIINHRIRDYIKNIFGIILICSACLSALTMLKFDQFGLSYTTDIQNSLIAQIGHFLEFAFAPLGFDWKIIVALLSGLISKEVSVSSLGILMNSSSTQDVTHAIKFAIPFATSASFLTFMFFYLPCISATATFAKEVKNYQKVIALIAITTTLAYSMSFLIYSILN